MRLCFSCEGQTMMSKASRSSCEGLSVWLLPLLAAGVLFQEGRSRAAEADKPTATFVGHTNVVSAVLFTPSATHLISASHDGTIRIWDLDTAKELREVSSGRVPPASEWDTGRPAPAPGRPVTRRG